MHRGELFRKTRWALAMLLILLVIRGTNGADDGEPGPEKFDRSSAYRATVDDVPSRAARF